MEEKQDIGWAVRKLHEEKRVCRLGWNGQGMWLELQVPDAHSKMQQPYVFITPGPGLRVPWVCSQVDLLATDWRECLGNPKP